MNKFTAIAISLAATAAITTTAEAATASGPTSSPPNQCYSTVTGNPPIDGVAGGFTVTYTQLPGASTEVAHYPIGTSYTSCMAAYNNAWNAGYVALVNKQCQINPPTSGYVDVNPLYVNGVAAGVSAWCTVVTQPLQIKKLQGVGSFSAYGSASAN